MNEQNGHKAIKLNLGSGAFPLPGYENRDHKFGNEIYPLEHATESVDEVRASHVLEHFPHGEIENVLKEWVRVLKPGGRIAIAVPDFDSIVKAYQGGYRNDFRLEQYLFGGQQDSDDYHKALFNEDKLQKLMEGAGLIDIKKWPADADDCSSYEVSLNLEGRKPEAEIAQCNVVPTYEFIKDSKGVIHVGANMGQERDIYAKANLPVVWIEAIPSAYEILRDNIGSFHRQIALNYLITEQDGAECDFHISSNKGESSSIFEFQEHKNIWPGIEYVGSRRLPTYTLKTVIERHAIDLAEYDTLILDVQGAELLVLKGLGDLLDCFKLIRCEAADFPLYSGGCELKDLDQFFTARGWQRTTTWRYPGPNGLYEVLYTKKAEAKLPPLTPIYIEDEKTGSKALVTVAVLTSIPRLGFTAHAVALQKAFGDPPLTVLRSTGAFWEQSMQNGMNSLIRRGADFIICIDYDSIFTNADVKELLKLIVRYPEADAIAAWQPKRGGGKDEALAGIRTERGWDGKVSVDEMKRNDLQEVDNTVFGLTIIRVEALKRMPKPWFLNVPNAEGEWEEGKFDADSRFWHIFREAGNRVFMANKVRIGHLWEGILWVDEDFNFYKQELFDWYRSGRPF